MNEQNGKFEVAAQNGAANEIEIPKKTEMDAQVLVGAVRALGDRISGHLQAIENRLAKTEERVGHLERGNSIETAEPSERVNYSDEIELRDNEIRAMKEIHRVIDLCRTYKKKAVQAEKSAQNVTNSVTRLREKVGHLEAELERRTQEVRYQIGDAFVKAAKPSWDSFALPVRLLKLFRQGRKQQAERSRSNGQTYDATFLPATPNRPARGNSYLFFCVNGAGLGHLTRSLAIARRVRESAPDSKICFLTSSQALSAITREGHIAYHLPPNSALEGEQTHSIWNNLLAKTIESITDVHEPDTLVFDGVVPYGGLVRAMERCAFHQRVMVMRLRHKHGGAEAHADRFRLFEHFVLPGEAQLPGEGQDEPLPRALEGLSCKRVAPIIHLSEDDLLTREDARRTLGLSLESKVIYVQLGAGNINDIEALTGAILDDVGSRDGVEVVLAESPIALRVAQDRPGIKCIRDYPNARFYRAFDLAITAVGYNTFHELLHFGVPSIFIPNCETKTDDQMARAVVAERAGAALVITDLDELSDKVDRALEPQTNQTMAENARQLVPENGAYGAAEFLINVSKSRVVV